LNKHPPLSDVRVVHTDVCFVVLRRTRTASERTWWTSANIGAWPM